VHIRWAGRGRAVAGLGDVAGPGRGAADGASGGHLIRGAGVVHAVAALGDVAGAGRRPADGRALLVRRAARARPRAVPRRVADAARGPAHDGCGGQRVGRAVVARAVAALGDVAWAGRRAADPRALLVRWTVVTDAVTALGRIARARRGAAFGGALPVGRAVV